MQLLPKGLIKDVPRIYSQEQTPVAEQIVYVHLFAPMGDWWFTECSEDGKEAFGYTRLHSMPECAELGYTYIPDLQVLTDLAIKKPFMKDGNKVRLRQLIQRDIYWTPEPLGPIMAEVKRCLATVH
jgi:hypothetical protein|tara:strand:- start:2048 stop:2425 length:378 start_codon:yes stop_codon:yes gene_type:complete